MEIQTISSLAGLRAVPAAITTYGAALTYIDTLATTLNAAGAQLSTANAARRIASSSFNKLVATQADTSAFLGQLQGAFGAQSHGATLSTADAHSLADLELQVQAFVAGVTAGISGSAKWVWIGLGAVGVAGALAWAAGWLPSYGRKRRRRGR